jgi:hypothetical protein
MLVCSNAFEICKQTSLNEITKKYFLNILQNDEKCHIMFTKKTKLTGDGVDLYEYDKKFRSTGDYICYHSHNRIFQFSNRFCDCSNRLIEKGGV